MTICRFARLSRVKVPESGTVWTIEWRRLMRAGRAGLKWRFPWSSCKAPSRSFMKSYKIQTQPFRWRQRSGKILAAELVRCSWSSHLRKSQTKPLQNWGWWRMRQKWSGRSWKKKEKSCNLRKWRFSRAERLETITSNFSITAPTSSKKLKNSMWLNWFFSRTN